MYLDVGAPSGIRTHTGSGPVEWPLAAKYSRFWDIAKLTMSHVMSQLVQVRSLPAHILVMSEQICDLPTLRASRRAVITRSEAAQVLEVDVRTLSRAIEQGQVPSIQVGRRVVIPREAFLDLVDRGAA